MEISKEKRVYARRLLQCLAVAIRPLHIKELAEVFVFNIDTEGAIPELVTGFRPADPEGAVLSACSSLVTIDGSMLVQLSHASVKEFLTSDRLTRSSGRLSYYHFSFEPAHLTLAQACLGVLLQLEDHLDRRDSIEKFPLAAYAAEHWVDHARFNNVASLIQEGMELLFDPAKPHFANWVRIYDMDQPLRSPTPHAIRSNATPLYYAALCGIPSLVERLIVERHMDVNARGGHYGTAIQAALYKGHLSIVRLLIEHNADVNSKDDDGSSPLHMAAQIGDHEAVSFLLSYRTDVQATDSGHSLVFSALNSGNVAVTRLHGADTNARDEMDLTSLHIPSNNGDFEHIRVLLERAADVNSQDNQGSTPLHLASAKGNDSVVRLLIEHRAEVNALDNTNSTPLHLASLNGNSDVVVLLIEYGAIVDARDSKNSTPLHLASAKGDDKVVKLLIEHGAYVNAKGEKGMTPLHAASRRGPFDVVKLLLEYGAEPNARNDDVQTPLHIASQEGVIDVVQCLLTARADANVQDRDGKTPRDLASINKKSEVVQLLTKPARPTVRDNRRQMSFKLQAVGSPQQAVGSPRSPRV
jgi:ankyrin repeat protein